MNTQPGISPYDIIERAAFCLRDDPSFKFLTKLEDQRAEARLVLAAIPGADESMADEVLLAALDGLEDGHGGAVEEIEVARANYAGGEWKGRKISVTRPKLADVLNRKPAPVPTPYADAVKDEVGQREIRYALSAKRKASISRQRKAEARLKAKLRQALAPEFLIEIKDALNVTSTGMSTLLGGRKRAAVETYLGGKVPFVPTRRELAVLITALDERARFVAETQAKLRAFATQLPTL